MTKPGIMISYETHTKMKVHVEKVVIIMQGMVANKKLKLYVNI